MCIRDRHTLGVDGGYTQQDVQEVARCFTGWTIDRLTGQFIFRPRLHDNGAKVVLGHDIPAGGGINDGEMVLNILCTNPSCAHFISKELCLSLIHILAPKTARLIGENESESDVALEQVKVGNRLRVRPGEKVPVDGLVLEGRLSLIHI